MMRSFVIFTDLFDSSISWDEHLARVATSVARDPVGLSAMVRVTALYTLCRGSLRRRDSNFGG